MILANNAQASTSSVPSVEHSNSQLNGTAESGSGHEGGGEESVGGDRHSMTGSSASYFTPLSGRLISASKDTIKRAIQVSSK